MDKTAQLSHVTRDSPSMVDVSYKTATKREATAVSFVSMPVFVADKLKAHESVNNKGPVFHTAIVAGTMAVKNTSMLIPFCHPINIDHVHLTIEIIDSGRVRILCKVKTLAATGVEMEALTGASIAALTIYDMCKSASLDIKISDTKLLKKTGGKNDRKIQKNGHGGAGSFRGQERTHGASQGVFEL